MRLAIKTPLPPERRSLRSATLGRKDAGKDRGVENRGGPSLGRFRRGATNAPLGHPTQARPPSGCAPRWGPSRAKSTWAQGEAISRVVAVTDRLAEIERNGNHWLEPLVTFVHAAHQAQIVASGHDLESLKDFLKRIGSRTSGFRAAPCASLTRIRGPFWPGTARRPRRARPKSAKTKNGGPGRTRTYNQEIMSLLL